MEFLTELWLPIVLSAVIVFVASMVIWMATPLHKGDFSTPPDEAGLQAAIKGYKPGQYFVPWCAGGNMKDPGYQARLKQGPWAMLVVMSGPPSFGRSLAQWFLHQVVLAAVIAYAAAAALPMGAGAPEYLKVFRVVGAIALLAQAGMWSMDSIWKGVPWRISLVKAADGLVYALLTAGVFAWLWPRGLPA